MSLGRFALALILPLGASCSSPAKPSDLLPFTDGKLYNILILGYDIVSTPTGTTTSCEPLGVPRQGKSVTIAAIASWASGPLVFRSEVPGDTFALTLAPDGRSVYGATVVGSVSGSAANTLRPLGYGLDTRLTAIEAKVDGTMPLGTSGFVLGNVNGNMTFADSAGNAGHCSAANISIQPWYDNP